MKAVNQKIFIAVSAAVLLYGAASAQQKVVRVSQGASVSQTIGLTDISVTYHRPGVKGREIWGKLVPYDQVWRAGANEATTVTFSDDATIAGKQLKAGTYSFFVTPRHGDWTVIFNSQPKQWGAYSYDSTKDALKFSVKPETAAHEEWLSYNFSDLTTSSVKLVLRWEKIALPITIEVSTDANMVSANSAAVTAAWQQLSAYARYCLDSKTNLDKGLEAIEKSIVINENAGSLRTKAELLAQSGKAKDAITVAEKAIKVGKAANPKFDSSDLEKLMDEWKKK
jgi:tetratricopeptide (TPR) repeat protein